MAQQSGDVPAPAGPPRAARCTHKGCDRAAGSPCMYVDRNRNRCPASFCDEHRVVMGTRQFCRRHAGVIAALRPGSQGAESLPDLGNRAASLVHWVARDLDEAIRTLLAGDGVDPTEVTTGSAELVFVGAERERAWRLEWATPSLTAAVVTIDITVTEARDGVFVIAVDRQPLADVIPPWISQRGSAKENIDVETQRRIAFYERVLQAVRSAVEHRREEGDAPEPAEA